MREKKENPHLDVIPSWEIVFRVLKYLNLIFFFTQIDGKRSTENSTFLNQGTFFVEVASIDFFEAY